MKHLKETKEVILPDNLRKSYYLIESKFNKILEECKSKHELNKISIGHEFDNEILDFLLNIVEYMGENYENMDIKKWSKFLSTYPINFYYGQIGDDYNYILDDTDYGYIFSIELNDYERIITLKKLKSIKGRLIKSRKIMNEYL